MNNLFLSLFLFFICGSVNAQGGFKGLIRDSVEAHPSVLSFEGQLDAAKMDLNTSTWGFYPTPSVSYESANKTPYGALDKVNRYLRLQQPIWTAGRLTAQVDKSESQYRVAGLMLEEQKLNIAFRCLQLWSEYQSADDKIKAYTQSEKKHLEYVLQIERRVHEGFSALNEVQLSLSRLSSVQADLRQAQSAKINAGNKLEQMLGRSLASEVGRLDDSGWPLNQKSISHWTHVLSLADLDESSNAHPAVQKSMTLISSAQADEALVRSRNMPEVYLRSEARQGDMTGTSHLIYVGLSSNLGAGLSNLSAVAAAKAKVDAQRSDVAARQMEVRETIEADSQNFHTQFDRLGQLEKTYISNHKYLESSERQYLAGRRSWQEIMNIAREESQILAQIADAKAQVWLMHQRLQIFTSSLSTYLSANTQSALPNTN